LNRSTLPFCQEDVLLDEHVPGAQVEEGVADLVGQLVAHVVVGHRSFDPVDADIGMSRAHA
jgi:hypothetical protein